MARVRQSSTTLKEEAVERNTNKRDPHQARPIKHPRGSRRAPKSTEACLVEASGPSSDLSVRRGAKRHSQGLFSPQVPRTCCQAPDLPGHCAHMENTSPAARRVLISTSWAGAWLWMGARAPNTFTWFDPFIFFEMFLHSLGDASPKPSSASVTGCGQNISLLA